MANMFLLVESGPILVACEEWRNQWKTARQSYYDFALKMGSAGWFDGFNGEIIGLIPTNPIPDGWMVIRSRNRNAEERMIPRKGKDGKIARDMLASLPTPPSHDTISSLINHPLHYSWEIPDGSAKGSGRMGGSFIPVQLFWPTDTGPLMIQCPDVGKIIEKIKEDHPGCSVSPESWTPPSGTKIISEAKKDFLVAEATLKEEEASLENHTSG